MATKPMTFDRFCWLLVGTLLIDRYVPVENQKQAMRWWARQ